MPTGGDYRFIVLAENFPPNLVTNAPATEIGVGNTPAARGLDCTTVGYLKSGSCPASTTRIVQSYTISSVDYEWHFRRLWRVSTNKLIWGAPDYTSVYFPQGRGEIDLPEGIISKIIPVGSSLALMGTAGTFLLQNANDPNANFRQVDIIQEAILQGDSYVVEMDNLIYFSNTAGLFSMNENGVVTELSLLQRGNAVFTAKPLTCEYDQKFVVFDSDKAAYDVVNKKFFDYSSSGFLYQSPSLKQPNGEPFACRSIKLEIEHGDTSDKDIVYDVRVGNGDWLTDQTKTILYDTERDNAFVTLEQIQNGRTFDFRITSMPSTLYIKRIYAEVAGFTQRSRDQ